MSPFFRKSKFFSLSLLFILIAVSLSYTQRRTPARETTGSSDVVFAIAFSPDGQILAIARGASDPVHRYGRIELWDTESGKLRHVIAGFDGPVLSVSFSPDGRTLVSGSREYRFTKIHEKAGERVGTILAELKWWDAQTGELKDEQTLPGEANLSLRAIYSPDGEQLAVTELFSENSRVGPYTASSSTNPQFPIGAIGIPIFRGTLNLLDAQTGEVKSKLSTSREQGVRMFPPFLPSRALVPFTRELGGPYFSPDGQFLAAINGGEVRLWNAQTGKAERKLKGFHGAPNAIAFSRDGKILAVVSTKYSQESTKHEIKIIGTSEVKLFDASTWKVTFKLSDQGAINSLAFDPTGKALLVGGILGEQPENAVPAVELFDLQTGKSEKFPTGGEDFKEAVDSLVMNPKGRLLAFRAGAATVRMVDTQNWKVKQTFDESSAGDLVERPISRFLVSVKRVLAVAFSTDGKTLSGETDQGEIKFWDPRTGEVKNKLSNEKEDPSRVAVSSDGRSFAEAGDRWLRLWHVDSNAKRNISMPKGAAISALALSPNGQTLAVGNDDGVVLISTATGTVLTTLTPGWETPVECLVFSDDGLMVAAADQIGSIGMWNLPSERLERTINAGSKISALRFAPDGKVLAGAGVGHSIFIWNAVTGVLLQTLQKHKGAINALAFSPNGQLLASGSDDRSVIIWEAATGKARRTLKPHDQTVTSVVFSPDGRSVASGSGNTAVVLWEVKTGKLDRVLK